MNSDLFSIYLIPLVNSLLFFLYSNETMAARIQEFIKQLLRSHDMSMSRLSSGALGSSLRPLSSANQAWSRQCDALGRAAERDLERVNRRYCGLMVSLLRASSTRDGDREVM